MNRKTKPGAKNMQERAGAPVATSFRFLPAEYVMLDELCQGGGELGEDVPRAHMLRILIKLAWRKRFKAADKDMPTTQTVEKVSGKWKRKGGK